jgi:hypothetical protein
MFDGREGISRFDLYGNYLTTNYPTGTIPWNGVMSLIDIDVTNFRRFVDGEFNGKFPSNAALPGGRLSNDDVPSDNPGRLIYVSDRRGDRDFDGEYDMEDIYGPNDGNLQPGEDVNGDTILNVDNQWEGSKYLAQASWLLADAPLPITNSATTYTDLAAFFDHRYYRRGVRLINGTRLPGNSTTGLTLASENGVYILGNYNATGIRQVGNPLGVAGDPTPAEDFLPDASNGQVPASVVADAVTILSNAWNDGKSFRYALYHYPNRQASETTIRAALLSGDTISNLSGSPNQGGTSARLNGGVNNLKRFIETWGGVRLNYCGSLINLFNSRNNNGAWKDGYGSQKANFGYEGVFFPPVRNWVFDTSFLDPTRLPPATPFFQYVQMTGFQRTNN